MFPPFSISYLPFPGFYAPGKFSFRFQVFSGFWLLGDQQEIIHANKGGFAFPDMATRHNMGEWLNQTLGSEIL